MQRREAPFKKWAAWPGMANRRINQSGPCTSAWNTKRPTANRTGTRTEPPSPGRTAHQPFDAHQPPPWA